MKKKFFITFYTFFVLISSIIFSQEVTNENQGTNEQTVVKLQRQFNPNLQIKSTNIYLYWGEVFRIDIISRFSIDYIFSTTNLIVDTNVFRDTLPEFGRFYMSKLLIGADVNFRDVMSFAFAYNGGSLVLNSSDYAIKAGANQGYIKDALEYAYFHYKFSKYLNLRFGKMYSVINPIREPEPAIGINLSIDIPPVNYRIQVANGISIRPALGWQPLKGLDLQVGLNFVMTNLLMEIAAHALVEDLLDIPLYGIFEYGNSKNYLYGYASFGFFGRKYKNTVLRPFGEYFMINNNIEVTAGLIYSPLYQFLVVPSVRYDLVRNIFYAQLSFRHSLE